jgi:UDP-N-acetylglucosamine pyrophosphorylase
MFCLPCIFSDWDRIKSPGADQIVPYSQLPIEVDTEHLNKLACLKVNGGLGTSMGMFFFFFVCTFRSLIFP